MVKIVGKSMPKSPLSAKQDVPEIKHDNREENEHYNKLLESLGRTDDQLTHYGLTYIATANLQPGLYQPRKSFDEDDLDDLAESIRSQGVIEPLIVRTVSKYQYEIISGERRWRAARLMDVDEVPCIVRDDLDDKSLLIIALIENVQRENLNPMEEARAYRRLANDFSLSHQEIALSVGRSRSAISNLMRFNDLPITIQEALDNRKIEAGHAKAIASLIEDKQIAMVNKIILHAWSVRETERAVQALKQIPITEKANTLTPYTEGQMEAIKSQLNELTDKKASIRVMPNGKIQVTFASIEALNKILH